MKIVRENINFERDPDNPFRSLDIGQHHQIKKELESDNISLEESMNIYRDLLQYDRKSINKSLNRYKKDPYWQHKMNFLEEMLIDIPDSGPDFLTEKKFLDWLIKYKIDIDPNPATLIDTIEGTIYDIQMD